MKTFITLQLFLSLMLCAAAHAGSTVTQSFAIENVSAIEVTHAATVEIRQADRGSLSASAAPEALERAIVEMEGGTLKLGIEDKRGGLWSWFDGGRDDIHFVVEVRDLRELKLKGAVQARVGALQVDKLTIESTGASELKVGDLSANGLSLKLVGASHAKLGEIQAKTLKVEATGASHITVTRPGSVDQLAVELSGASRYKGAELAARHITAEAGGASHAEVGASRVLDATAYGASHINYRGEPEITQRSVGASHIASR